MEQLASLVAANVAFVGGHFVMSHPLRPPLVRTLGERGFMGLHALVSLATFAWIVLAFLQIGPSGETLWDGQTQTAWVSASLLTIMALVLIFGSLKGNPALPRLSAETAARAEANGVLAVTRHPMMWGIAVWAIAHIIVSPSPRTLVTASAMAVLGLLGSHLQERRKRALLGEAWKGWEARTTFWPNWAALLWAGRGVWLAAVIGWLAITWLHRPLGTVPAGIWRWVG